MINKQKHVYCLPFQWCLLMTPSASECNRTSGSVETTCLYHLSFQPLQPAKIHRYCFLQCIACKMNLWFLDCSTVDITEDTSHDEGLPLISTALKSIISNTVRTKIGPKIWYGLLQVYNGRMCVGE